MKELLIILYNYGLLHILSYCAVFTSNNILPRWLTETYVNTCCILKFRLYLKFRKYYEFIYPFKRTVLIHIFVEHEKTQHITTCSLTQVQVWHHFRALLIVRARSI